MSKQDLILLTLDASPTLDLMVRAFHSASYEVAVVHDQPGLEKSIQQAIPALMIVGEMFSGQDGFSIATNTLERFPTMPIILYAEKDTPGLAQRVIKAGISGYLHPPLKLDDLVEEVNRTLVRARKLGDWLRREVKRTTASLEQKAQISEAERNKLDGIISNIQDGVLVLDESHHILLANKTIYEIFNLDNNPILGKYVKDVINSADLSALIDRARNGALKYHEINFDDGRVYNAQYTPLPRIGSAVTMQDISYLK
ncbi:MAG TPA: response regulator, partial [Anaerolineales bacterium]|nr:response regulator [Anaerolineales bacterium]